MFCVICSNIISGNGCLYYHGLAVTAGISNSSDVHNRSARNNINSVLLGIVHNIIVRIGVLMKLEQHHSCRNVQ